MLQFTLSHVFALKQATLDIRSSVTKKMLCHVNGKHVVFVVYCAKITPKGLFTPWTMKSSHCPVNPPVKYVIGC